MGIIHAFANHGELSFTNLPNRWEMVASKLNIEKIIPQTEHSFASALIQYSFFLFFNYFLLQGFLFDKIITLKFFKNVTLKPLKAAPIKTLTFSKHQGVLITYSYSIYSNKCQD